MVQRFEEFVREILNDMDLDLCLNISLKTGFLSLPTKQQPVEIAAATWPQVAEENSGNRDPGFGESHHISRWVTLRCQTPKTQHRNAGKGSFMLLDRSGATPLWVSFFWYPGQIKDLTKRQVMETWWNSWELSVWCVPRDCVLALNFSKGKTMGMAGGNLVIYSWYLLMAFATCHALKDFEFDIHVLYTRKQSTRPQMKRVQKIMAKSNKFIHIFCRQKSNVKCDV